MFRANAAKTGGLGFKSWLSIRFSMIGGLVSRNRGLKSLTVTFLGFGKGIIQERFKSVFFASNNFCFLSVALFYLLYTYLGELLNWI